MLEHYYTRRERSTMSVLERIATLKFLKSYEDYQHVLSSAHSREVDIDPTDGRRVTPCKVAVARARLRSMLVSSFGEKAQPF